jgi:hypothetical protein
MIAYMYTLFGESKIVSVEDMPTCARTEISATDHLNCQGIADLADEQPNQ